MNKRQRLLAGAAVILTATSPAWAASREAPEQNENTLEQRAEEYTVVGIGLEGTQSDALALNDRGQVVLLQDDDLYLYDGGNYTNLTALYGIGPGYYGISDAAINNKSQIVITTNDSYGNAVLLSKEEGVTNLNTLGHPNIAIGINNSGQVVGEYWDDNRYTYAFLYSKDQIKDLNLGPSSSATAINESGVITGWYALENSYQAFLYKNEIKSNITPFGSQQSVGYDINNQDQIVGEFLTTDMSATHAFFYSDGKATDLGTLNGSDSSALALNERGDVVGTATVLVREEIRCEDYSSNRQCYKYVEYSNHAFVYKDGLMADLNKYIPADSGWVLSAAYDINNRGQIVGVGIYHGEQHGFLLTPKGNF